MEPLYLTTITCICCETSYQDVARQTKLQESCFRDSDFCAYYKDDINPDYYVVRVCPKCGYRLDGEWHEVS